MYIFTSLKEHFTSQKKIEYLTQANVIANTVAENTPFDKDVFSVLFSPSKVQNDIRFYILDKDAIIIFDTRENSNMVGKALLKEEVLTALKGKDGANINHSDDAGWTFDIAVPVIKAQETIGVVYLAVSAETTMNFVNEVSRNLIIISIFVSILIGILSAIFAGIITEPIERLTKFILGISKAGKIPKIDMKRNDEIGQLASAFNDMSDRINTFDEKKQDFVANVSHEFKTPLSTIKLLSDSIMQMQVLDMDVVKEFLGDINNEVERLTNITEDLLEQTKLEIEQSTFDMQMVSLNVMVLKIIDSLSMVAKAKEITIVMEAEKEIMLLADYDKLWQAIYNIIDNGIKYTNQGGKIEINLFQNDKETEIFIKDNGIGIPQDSISKIFDRFYRVDKARSRDTGGTGLGLSIALSSVELHKGKIEVESVVGEGTLFKITLPNE